MNLHTFETSRNSLEFPSAAPLDAACSTKEQHSESSRRATSVWPMYRAVSSARTVQLDTPGASVRAAAA